MAGSVNKAIIVGNLGKDPEIRTMQSGDRVCNLSIATSESWKDKITGERKEKTEWHRITIFNAGIVDVAEKWLKKGAKVYIEGQIETRKWQDQQGIDHYATEIVLRPFKGVLTMLTSPGGEREEQSSGSRSSIPPGYAPGPSPALAPPGAVYGESRLPAEPPPTYSHDLDDEIPF